MFTACTCDCCGVRERLLLCSPDCFDDAKDDFFTKYPSLKAVEVGSDIQRVGRIEVMFENGDALSVGLECASSEGSSSSRFLKLCNSLITLAHLEKCSSTECKTRRAAPTNDTSPEHVPDGVVTKDEADRHMMELLAEVECESAPKPRTSEHKRQKKKKKKITLMTEGACEKGTACMCKSTLPSGPDEFQ